MARAFSWRRERIVQPLEKNIYRLPHPSATGSLPPHTLETTAGYRLSLAKVTSDEICIDAYITSYSTRPERAIENVKTRLKPDRDGIGSPEPRWSPGAVWNRGGARQD